MDIGIYATTGYVSPGALALSNPLKAPRYGYVVSLNATFQWLPNDSSTIDNINVIGSNANAGRWKRVVSADAATVLTNADATVDITSGAWHTLPAATLTGNHVLTLSSTGAFKGNRKEITRLDLGAFTYTIANGGPGGGNVCVHPVSARSYSLAYFDGTNWLHRSSSLML